MLHRSAVYAALCLAKCMPCARCHYLPLLSYSFEMLDTPSELRRMLLSLSASETVPLRPRYAFCVEQQQVSYAVSSSDVSSPNSSWFLLSNRGRRHLHFRSLPPVLPWKLQERDWPLRHAVLAVGPFQPEHTLRSRRWQKPVAWRTPPLS
jgi:hypothetical protein